jgi:hypothetical protein
MAYALGNVLPLAVAVAIFPVPVIVSVLMVVSDRGCPRRSHSWAPGSSGVTA